MTTQYTSDVKVDPSVPPVAPTYPAPGYQQQYQNARPLNTLSRYVEVVDCPACHARGPTRILHQTSSFTHLSALIACFVACVPCVPYLMSTFKDVQHYCNNCNTLLATHHRSGGIEVHAFT